MHRVLQIYMRVSACHFLVLVYARFHTPAQINFPILASTDFEVDPGKNFRGPYLQYNMSMSHWAVELFCDVCWRGCKTLRDEVVEQGS